MTELVGYTLIGVIIWAALLFLTPLVWWVCALLALVVVVLGIWIGPELF